MNANDPQVTEALVRAAADVVTFNFPTVAGMSKPLQKEAGDFLRKMWKQTGPADKPLTIADTKEATQ